MKKKLSIVLSLVMMSTLLMAGTVANAEEDVTLSVLDGHAYGLDEYEEMKETFEEENPNITIEVQHEANDSDTILASLANSNQLPDVFDCIAGSTASLYYEYAYDWSQDEDILALFNDSAIASGTDADGNVMALPWNYEDMGLIYNKDLFEEAGIEELPTTIDELEEVCQKLDDAGITAFAIAANEDWTLAQLAQHFMLDKELDAKGTVEALASGELTFDDLPHWQNLFKVLDLIVEYGPDKPLEIDWETSENMLANGEAAIIHQTDACQSNLDSFNPDANLAFLPCPVSDDPDDVTLLSAISWSYIVNKDSENLDAAKQYLVYILTSDMGQWWICDGVGIVPAAKTDLEPAGALAKDAIYYVDNGLTNDWILSYCDAGFNELGSYLQAYMMGDMSADEVTQLFQEYFLTQG